MYRISYRFLGPGWSAKPLVSAHDRIMGTHTAESEPAVAVRWDPDLSPRDVSTVHSTGDHPSPPTHQTSQIDKSKSFERPAVADSAEMPPDQLRPSFGHPQVRHPPYATGTGSPVASRCSRYFRCGMMLKGVRNVGRRAGWLATAQPDQGHRISSEPATSTIG